MCTLYLCFYLYQHLNNIDAFISNAFCEQVWVVLQTLRSRARGREPGVDRSAYADVDQEYANLFAMYCAGLRQSMLGAGKGIPTHLIQATFLPKTDLHCPG